MWPIGFEKVDFAEAIDFFKSKAEVSDDEYDALAASAKRKAFKVAGVTQLDVVHGVWQAIDRALKEGTDLEDFKKEVGQKLIDAWEGSVANPAHRIETIFRTNTQVAYGAGRWKQLTDPDVAAVHEYLRFDAVSDTRTTPTCRSLNGTILPVDDSFWKTRVPPLHHACRSTLVPLTKKAAEDEGITKDKPTAKADEGFGLPPDEAEWEPKKTDYPAPLWKEYAAKKPEPATPTERLAAATKDGKVDVEKLDAVVASKEQKGVAAKAREDFDAAYLGREHSRKGERASVALADVRFEPDMVSPAGVQREIESAEQRTARDKDKPEQPAVAVLIRKGKDIFPASKDDADRVLADLLISDGKATAIVLDATKHAQPEPISSAKDFGKRLDAAFKSNDHAAARDSLRAYLASDGIRSRDVAWLQSGANEYAVESAIGGANGTHDWKGRVEVTRRVWNSAREAAESLAAGRTDLFADEVKAIGVLVHEELHGASPIASAAYVRFGVGVEEAITEILTRRTVRRMLGLKNAGLDGDIVVRTPTSPDESRTRPYDAGIQALVDTTRKALKLKDGQKALDRLEKAAIKLRSAETANIRLGSAQDHASELADHLGLSGKVRSQFLKGLQDHPWMVKPNER